MCVRNSVRNRNRWRWIRIWASGLEMQEKRKQGHWSRWAVFGVSLCSQSGQRACQVMAAFGWAAGVCSWQSAAEWRRSEMLWCSYGMRWRFGRAGDKQAPTEARLRPEGRTRAKSQLTEWSLCVGYRLCRPTALSSWLPNSYQSKLLMAIWFSKDWK